MGAHRFHVEPDELAAAAVAGFFEHVGLVEGDAQVGRAEVLVLIFFSWGNAGLTSGPKGSAPSLMFQGPKEKR